MKEKTAMILVSSIIRIALNKKFDVNVEGVIPISSNDIEKNFEEMAHQLRFDFHNEGFKNLCKKLFEVGFLYTMVFKDESSEKRIEDNFRTIAEDMDLPHYIRMQTFFWFRNGVKKCESCRSKYSIIYHLNNGICEKLGTDQRSPDDLPSQKEFDRLFKAINPEIFEDIDIDQEIIENTCAEIAFQCGYLTAMNMDDLDDEFINIVFQEIIGNTFDELKRSKNEILTYYLLFKEGYKALTSTRWGFF